jgi:hypothetical protein
MDKDATVQKPDEPSRLEQDWAEAEWFKTWLLLARRDYQDDQSKPEFKRGA